MNDHKHYVAKSLSTLVALVMLTLAMGGAWQVAGAGPASAIDSPAAIGTAEAASGRKPAGKAMEGKLNLNTATEDQLMLLPTIGPAKAERIVTWRKKHGGFKRIADLRRVKGFGYKTFKRLARFLAIEGETTLAAK